MESTILTFEENGEIDSANQLLLNRSKSFYDMGMDSAYLADKIRIAINLQGNGQFEKSIDVLQASLDHSNDSILVKLKGNGYHKLGVAHYYLNEYNQAIAAYKQALNYRKKYLPQNHKNIGKTLANLGHVFVETKDMDNAISHFEESMKMAIETSVPDTSTFVIAGSNLSFVLALKDDFKKSEEYLNLVIAFAKEFYANEIWEMPKYYSQFAFHIAKRKGDTKAMIKYTKNAISIYDKIEDKYDEDWYGLSSCYSNLGNAYLINEDYPSSKEYFLKDLEINEKYPKERLFQTGSTLNSLSVAYGGEGNFKESQKQIEKARNIFIELKDSFWISNTYHNEGLNAIKRGEYDLGISKLNEAIGFINADIIIDDANVIGGLSNLIEIKSEIAKAQLAFAQNKNALKDAFNSYVEIDILLGKLREDFNSDESKKFLLNKARDIYASALSCTYQLWESTGNEEYLDWSFSFMEKTKAIILLDAISKSQSLESLDLSSQEREKLDSLNNQISSLELNQDVNDSDQLITQIKSRIQLEEFEKELKEKYPTLQTNHQEDFLAVSEMQSKLTDESRALLEFFIDEDILYALYIDAQNSELFRWTIDNNLSNKVFKFRNLLDQSADRFTYNKSQRDSLFDAFELVSREFYRLLIKPIQLKYDIPEKLCIIPDQYLSYLPFDAIMVKSDQSTTFLTEKYNISYSYSASLFNKERINTKTKRTSILSFAPYFHIDNPLVTLSFNKQEVESISSHFKVDAYTGKKALKYEFKERAENHPVIHLSSHAVTNDSISDRSYISFAQESSSLNQDQLLYAGELYNTKVAADLIVLSACETGLGKIEEGEGVMSLARAFTYAGAGSVISSLWRIDDEFSSQLISDFYAGMKEGKQIDESLWGAKKKALEDPKFKHPYYWAAFVPTGKMDAIDLNDFNTSIPLWGYPIFFLILMVLFYVWWGIRKRYYL